MLRIYSAIHLQHWSPAERESKAHQAEPSVWKTWERDFKMKTPCSVLNKLTLLTYQYETKQEEG